MKWAAVSCHASGFAARASKRFVTTVAGEEGASRPPNTADQLRAVPPSVLPAGAQGGTSACSTGAALSLVSS